jgi:NAD(P)-dependent dehydrogenase (short-subunit alcohol dehydrogenase family)
MAGLLDGRVALVTGGARGIGAAAATALAEAGAAVLITDVLDADGEATAEGLRAAGHKARYRRHDVTSEAEWTATVAAAEEAFGGLDILLNNAGIFFMKSIADTTIEEFRRMEAVNIEGVFLGMKCAAPAIAKRAERWDGGGSIINLSSVAGLRGAAFACAYNASKGAVKLMTKSAALEMPTLGYKIRVNSIHPGVIETKMGQQVVDGFASRGGGANEARVAIASLHALGHMGRPLDIANAAVFLASDMSAFVTGSELVVDGGMTAR